MKQKSSIHALLIRVHLKDLGQMVAREIDLPNRKIELQISEGEFKIRKDKIEAKVPLAWKPKSREGLVSAALRAYAAMTISAHTGAV